MKHCLYFERLGLLKSFRSLWVCCKSSFYWDFEFSYEHLVTTWNRRHTILSYQCTIHWYYYKHFFVSWVPLTTVCYISQKNIWHRKPAGNAGWQFLLKFLKDARVARPSADRTLHVALGKAAHRHFVRRWLLKVHLQKTLRFRATIYFFFGITAFFVPEWKSEAHRSLERQFLILCFSRKKIWFFSWNNFVMQKGTIVVTRDLEVKGYGHIKPDTGETCDAA